MQIHNESCNFVSIMKKPALILFISLQALLFLSPVAKAQCSVCTKTAQQMGEKPAKALNNAIIYLMLAPFGIAGVIGYRWWRSEKGEA